MVPLGEPRTHALSIHGLAQEKKGCQVGEAVKAPEDKYKFLVCIALFIFSLPQDDLCGKQVKVTQGSSLRLGDSNEYPQSIFGAKIRKIGTCIPQFSI